MQTQSLEAGHMSDTTASPPGSDDDEGGSAAGSIHHPSPAEHGGFESGASLIDSASGASKVQVFFNQSKIFTKILATMMTLNLQS